MIAIGQQHGRARRLFARALGVLAFASLGVLMLGSDAVRAAVASSTMTNSGGLSPRGKVCDTWDVSGISSGTTVTVEMRGAPTGDGSLGDPYVHVFDSGNVQRGADDDGGTGLNSRLSIVWQSGYYIGASVYSSGLNATYKVITSHGTLTKSTRSCGTAPKSNQTITFNNPGTRTYGTSFTLSATATSGLAVSFSSSTTNVCTVSGTTLNTISTGTCTITASQGGNASWNPAPNVTQSFTIAKANQTITFGTLSNRTYSPSAFAISATATSGLAVTFTSQTPTTCSVSGTNVTMLASGTCTIRADQAGNTLYNAATAVDRSFAISQASQTITYANPGQKASQASFTTTGTASSGLTVSFASQTTGVCTTGGTNGTTVTLVGVGTCTVRASQAGDSRYLAALVVDQSFNVVPADQTISFSLSGVSKTYGDPVFTVVATATSGLTPVLSSGTPGVCSVSGFTVTIRAAGSCSIVANQSGSTVYNAAPAVTQSFTVAQKALTAPNVTISARPYNGTNVAGAVSLGSIDGLVGSEQLVITPSAGAYGSVDVGTRTSTVTFSLANGSGGGIASNYSMAPVNVNGSITPRALLVAANDVARTADDSAPTFGVSTLGLVDGESVSTSTFSFVTVSAGSLVSSVPDHVVVGRYTVTPTAITLAGGRPTSNYSITYVAGDYRVTAGAPKKVVVPAFSGTAVSGQAFSVQPQVTITDVHGNRIIAGAGSVASVTANITSGSSGSLIGTTTANAADGIATFTNLGLSGLTSQTYVITYSSTVNGEAMTVATQSVTPSHGVATQLAVSASITAQVATPFSSGVNVDVLDAQGNKVLNSSATVTVLPNAGDLVGTKTVDASAGTASFGGLTLNAPVGNYTLTYSSPGLASVTQSATVEAGPAARMEIVTRAVGTRAGESFSTPPAILLTDAVGNPVLVAGNTVTATITQVNSTGALLVGGVESTTVSAQTDAYGVATFTGLGIVGLENTTYTLTFSSTVGSTVIPTARQLITVTQGPAYSLALDRGVAGAAAGVVATTQPRIKVLDRGGNLVTDPAEQVTVTVSAANLQGVNVTPTSSVTGSATFTDLKLLGTIGTYTVRYGIQNTAVSIDQSGVVLTAGPASVLATTSASTTAASGQPFGTATVVRVVDAYGNLVSNSTVSITAEIVSGNGSLIGTVTRPVINGSATFTGLGLRGVAGFYEIRYVAAGMAPASQVVALGHGAPAKLEVATNASGARAGSAMTTQPVIHVLDAEGNLVTSGSGSTASVSATSSIGSTFTGTTSVTAVGGVATFTDLRLDGRTGVSYALTFRSTVGSTTLTSASHNVTMATGDPVSLRLAQSAVGTRAGEVFTTQPRVELLDVSGNLVTSGAVTVTVSASAGATLTGANSVESSSGAATFSGLGISGTAGTSYTLTFGATGLVGVTQTVTVTPGAPVTLHLEVPSSAEVGSGSTMIGQPSVSVRDAAGNRVTDSSAIVTASVAGGATTVGNTRVGASSGVASFVGLGLNGTAGTAYTITYSSPGLTSVTQDVTVRMGAAVRLRLDTEASATGQSGVALATQPVVTLRDSGGNLVTTSAVTVTAVASSGVTLSAATATTSNGQATFGSLAVAARVASYTITYTAGSLVPVSQTITVNPGNPYRIVVDPQAKSVRTGSGEVLDLAGSVRIVDSAGNTVTTSDVQIDVSATTPQTATTSDPCAYTSSVEGGRTVLKFTSRTACNWVVPRGVSSIGIIAVGGGGGGGTDGGGGGGGGEVRYGTVSISENTPMQIAVGSGGRGGVHTSAIVEGVSYTSGGAANGGSTTITWSGSMQYQANGGVAGRGWDPTVGPRNAAGGSGGIGGTGANGGSGGDPVRRDSSSPGCPSSDYVNSGSAGSAGPSVDAGIGGVLRQFGGGGGGGIASIELSPTTAGQLGGAGGGGAGASHVSGSGASFGQSGGANSGGGGGAGAACNSFGSQDGIKQRTPGGNGADGVVYITYVAGSDDVGIKLSATTSVGVGNTLSVNAVNGVLPLGTFRIDGKAYDYTLTYSGAGLVSDTQTVRVESGTASKIDDTVVAAGARSWSAFITQPVVAVQDSAGNLVASSTATVSASIIGANASSVTLGGTTTINAVSGIASFSDLSLTGTAGTYTIEYSADLGSGSVVTTSAQITLEAGSAVKLLTSGTSTATAGATIPSFTVAVADASDNTVTTADLDVGVELTAGPVGFLSGRTTVSAVNGVATFDDLVIGGATGTYTLTIRAAGYADITRSVTVDAGTPAYMTLSQFDSDVASGESMAPSPTVLFFDAFGNAATSTAEVTATIQTVTIDGIVTGAIGSGTFTTATANGTAVTFNDVSVSGRAGQQYRIEFTASGLTPVVGLVTVSAGAPTSLVIVQEAADATSSLVLGVQPVVELRDSGGNLATGSTDTVTMSSSTLTFGQESIAAVNGLASFAGVTVSGSTTITHTVTYSATIGSSTITTTQSLVVEAGAPVQLAVVTAADGGQSGEAFTTQPVLEIQDVDGNRVTTVNGSVNVAVSGTPVGTLLGDVTTPIISGRATFSSLGLSGRVDTNYTLTFTGTVSATTFTAIDTVTVSAGAPASIELTVPAAGAESGVSFSAQPRITILDEGGNTTTSNASVTASASVGGTLIGSTTVNAVNGVADFTDLGLTGTAGTTYRITYSVDGMPPVAQNISLSTGPPTALVLAQAAAGARSGDVLTTVPQLQLVDSGGNDVTTAGVAVAVAISGDGSFGGPTTSATDASGLATFAGLVVNGTMGTEYALTFSATYNGAALQSASQNVRAQLGAAAKVALVNTPTGTASGVAFTTSPVLQIQDAGSNVIADSTVSVSVAITKVSGAAGGELVGTTVRSAVGGEVTFDGLGITGTTGQDYRITFSSTGLQSDHHDVTVSTGPAVGLAVISTTPTASAGVAFDPAVVVEIRDSGGNTVASSAQVVASVDGVASLIGSSVATASNGVATFGTLGVTGTSGTNPTLTFSVPGLQSASMTVTVSAGPAARLVIVGEDNARTAPSGGEFDLEPKIRIEDAGGNLVVGDSSTIVTATITQISVGGVATGVLVGGTTASAVSGVATFGTLGITGTAGRSYTITYTASVNGQSLVAATEAITVTTGAAVRLDLTQPSVGNAVGAPFTTAPIITVFDTGNNVVPSAGVDVVATISSGGSLIGNATVSANTGVATFSGLGIVGTASTTYTITYAAMNGATPVASIATVSQEITPRVGASTALVITQAIGGAASGTPFETQPIVSVIDAGGNVVTSSNVAVTATVASIDVNGVPTGVLAGTHVVNASDGVARFTDLALTGKSNLSYTVTFTAELSGTPATVTQSVQPSSGAAHSLGFVTVSAGAPAGEAFVTQPVIEVLDSAGNRALTSSRRVTVDVSAGATFVGTAYADAVSGLVTFEGLGLTGTADSSYTLTFSSGEITSVTQSVTVGVGRPTQLVLSQTSSATVPAGGTFATQPTLRIEDAGGNLVNVGAGSTLAITASIDPLDVGGVTTGVALGSTTATGAGGVATFSGLGMGGRAGVAYTMRYTASFGGVSLSAATQIVTPTFGSAASLRIGVPGSVAVVGEPLAVQPRIIVIDAFDNVVTNSTTIVTATISDGASLLGSTSRAAVDGQVVYTDLSARGVAGAVTTITYSATGLPSVSQSLTLLAGPPTRLVFEQQAAGAASGRPFITEPRLVIADSFGNRTTSNATVSATITQVAGSGILTGTTQVAASNGLVTFADLGIDGRAGTSYTIRFSSLGLSAMSQTIQVELGEPTSLEFVRPSIGTSVGTLFAQQPALVLKDAGGNVLTTSTASVSATVDQAGGSLLGTTTVGVVNGFANFTDLGIIGTNNTAYTVRYTSGSLSVTQVITARTGPALSVEISRASVGHTDNASFTTQPQVSLRDAAGNLVVETGASVTASLSGIDGVLIGTTNRPFISGVAAFTNLGIDGTPDEPYEITYSSAGLFSASETVTLSAATPGLVPQFATVSATVDGFSVDMTNHDASFTVTAVASAGGRVTIVDLGGGVRRFIVSAIGPDTPARLTVTTSKAGHTTETAFVDGRSQLRAGLTPQFGAITVTNDGFWVQITNFNSSYLWTAQSSAGGRAVISPTGRLTVSGLTGGVSVTATVTTTRTGYQTASASTTGVTTLQPASTPTFATPVSLTGGFTVQVTNHDPLFTYAASITPAGTVSIDGSGLVTVTGLINGTTATVLVTTSRAGHSNGNAAVVGRSLASAVTPSFGTVTPTATGWSVPIANYDGAFTWAAAVTSGSAQIAVVGGAASVNVVSSDPAVTLTVTTARTGYLPGTASLSLTRGPGLVPIFGSPTSIDGGFTVPILNHDPAYTWSVTSTTGSAVIGVDGTVTVSAVSATITVTTNRIGEATRSASYTRSVNPALAFSLATVSASLSGFVVSITGYDDSYSWSFVATRGSATRVNGTITVTGLSPGESSTVYVYADKDDHETGSASITHAAQSNPARVPEFGAATATFDGYVVPVTNYDAAYTWFVLTDGIAEATFEPTGASTAVVTVRSIPGGSSSTVTVATSRTGHADGSAAFTSTSLDGGGRLATFGPVASTGDGFAVDVTNHDNTYTWTVTSTNGSVSIDAGGRLTVTGLSAGQSSTVTVQTSRTGRLTRSVQFTAAALNSDGDPTLALGRVPRFGTVTPTADGFRAAITNYSSTWTWSAASGRNVTASVSSEGVLTVSGLGAGVSDVVVVTTNATGYSTGTASVQGTALAAGARAANLLSEVSIVPLCPHGSPDGEGADKVNDLLATSRYSCYTSAGRTESSFAANSIGFATGNVGLSVVNSITFTSASDGAARDPLTYTLWGCQAQNEYCSIIVSNDSTGLAETRGTDSTRSFRNTRAFAFYRVTFGSMRGTANTVHVAEVSFGGTSGLPAGLAPIFDTPVVSSNGFTVNVSNFSRLYTWDVSVSPSGRAAIDANGAIRVESLSPNSTNVLTVTTRRVGFADATSTLIVVTSNGAALIPAIGSVRATEDGLVALIENFDTPGFTWSVTTSAVSGGTVNAGTPQISSNGIVTVTGATPGADIRLVVTTARAGYLDGSNVVEETVLNDLGLITFADPTPLPSGFTVQVSNFVTVDSNGGFEWRVFADSGAVAAIDGDGLVTVSNLGAGASARVTVIRSQAGALSTSGSVTGRAVGMLTPVFGELVEFVEDGDDSDTGFVVGIVNFDPSFVWDATVSAGVVNADWTIGQVTVSAVPAGQAAILTVSASRDGSTGSASIGSTLDPPVIPVFSTPIETATGFTASITNWATVSAVTWNVAVAPAGTVSIDSNGHVTVSAAARGEVTTVTVTTSESGRLTGTGSVIFTVGARAGLTPSFGIPIPIVDGFTVQIANFNPDFAWNALASDGATAVVSSTGLVTVTGVSESVPVTVTVQTSRSGYQTASDSIIGSSRVRPGLVPQFGVPLVNGTGITVQIENYDPAYTWSAAVDNDGLVSISSTGRVTVTNLPGFTRATVVVSTMRAGFADQTGTLTATTLAGEPLVPRFAISTSTVDGFVVRIRNFDLRWGWSVTSPTDGVVGNISADGVLTVSGATTGALVSVEVRTERAGYQSGSAEFSAVARPTVANTIGPVEIERYSITSGVATVETKTAHGFAADNWIVIANLSPSLDGDHRILTASGSQFTIPTALADTVAVSGGSGGAVAGDESAEPGETPVEPGDEPVEQGEMPAEQGESDNSQPLLEGEGLAAQNIVTAAAWITPSQPAFVQLSETTVPVRLNDDGSEMLIRAFVTIPSLVSGDNTSMTVIAAMTEEAEAGYHMIRIIGSSSDGQGVTQLGDVVRILFEPPAEGAVPVQSSDDGLTWTPLTRLNAPSLPVGVNDGYYVNDDGTVWIFTRHLSFFGFLALQAVPLDVVGLPSSLVPGATGQLSVIGGEGDGDVSLSSLTPSVCTVDALGFFTAVTSGTCSLRAVKDANGRYLEAASITTVSITTPGGSNPGGGIGGGVGGGDSNNDDSNNDDGDNDDSNNDGDIGGDVDVEPTPEDRPPALRTPERPGSTTPAPGAGSGESSGSGDTSGSGESSGTTRPPSQREIDAVSEQTRTPLPPGSGSPAVNAERPVVVIENGEIVEVDVTPSPDGNGLVIRGDGFEVLVRGVDADGNALSLDGDLRLVIERGQSITIAGEGYAPNSIVTVFLFSTPVKLGEVRTDENGRFSATFTIPAEVEPGDHTVQINGVSPEGELRTLNVAIVVPDGSAEDGTSVANVVIVVIVVVVVMLAILIVMAAMLRSRRRRTGIEISSTDDQRD